MIEYQQYIWDRVQPEPMSGCWIWDQSLRSDGYGNAFAEGKVQVAHRLAYKAFVGPIPDDMCVLHRCDVRSCVNPDHLWLGTRADNNRDMWQKGRARPGRLSGEDHPQSKITESEARTIADPQMSVNCAMTEYGLSRTHVHAIKKGKVWKHMRRTRRVHG